MASAYFAQLPPFSRELGNRLLGMVDRWYEGLPLLRPYARARKVRQLYYGLPSDASPFDVTSIGRMGDAGELSALHLNRVHHLGQRFLTMGVSEDFGWQPVSANGDTASQEEAILAGSVLEHEKRASNLEAVRHKFNELALLDGWSYFSVRWDAGAGPKYEELDGRATYEGRLKVAVHEWWRVVIDLQRQDHLHDWVILTEFVNRYDLAAKYARAGTPESEALRARLLGLPPENQHVLRWQESARGRQWSPEESPLVPVYTLFHKPTPSVPQGREVVFVSDGTILFDGPSVYGEELPVHRVAANEWHGTPFGVSVLADIVAPQDAVNALVSTTFTNNVNYGLTNVATRRESGLNHFHMGGAAIWEVEGNPREDVVPMNLVASSPETGNLAKFLLGEMELLSGMNSVSLGRQEHQMPASLAALLDQKAREFAGFFVRSDKLAVAALGSAIIRCYRQFAKAPRVLEVIAGEGRRYMLEGFTGQRLGSISRVNVAVRSGMMSSPAGIMAFAENIVQTNALENPNALRALTSVWQRGNLDVVLAPVEASDMLMARENDMLARGQVPLVRAMDKHSVHILKHAEVTANPASRENDAVDDAVRAHIQEHIRMLETLPPDLLAMNGEKPLGMPQPMPGGPGIPPDAMPPPDGEVPPEGLPTGPMSEAMAGMPPDLPQPAQPPPGAPPALV